MTLPVKTTGLLILPHLVWLSLIIGCSSSTLPDPSLSPYDVVIIQLKALQQNDVPEQNHGISVAWRFASPNNRETTGPLERFVIMAHNENYRPLLNSRRYEVRVHFQEESKAEFFVLLEDKDGFIHSFMMGLSVQKQQPYEGCWMIDAIIPMDLPGNKQPKVAKNSGDGSKALFCSLCGPMSR